MQYTKWVLMLLTFCATVAQGFWSDWLQDELIVAVDFPLLLLFILGRNRLRQAPYAIPALVLALVFLAWSATGYFFAVSRIYFWQEMILNIRAFLIFLSIVLFVNRREDVQFLFLGFAIGVLFQGLVGLAQYTGRPVGLGFLGEHYLPYRATGTFVHPGVLGIYLSMLVVLTYRMAAFLRPQYHKLYVAAFFVGLGALYASLNRANWIAFAFSMIVMFLVDFVRGAAFSRKARSILIAIVLIGMAGTIKYGAAIISRFEGAEESLLADRTSSRLNLAKDAIRIMNSHPLLGTGLNNYREYVAEETAGLQIVHNTYLLVGAELGYPGMFIFLAMIGSFLFLSWRGTRSRDLFVKHVSTGLLGGVIAFLVAMMVSPNYRIMYVKNHIWIIWGLTVAVSKLDYDIQLKLRRRRRLIRQKRIATLRGDRSEGQGETKYGRPVSGFEGGQFGG